MSKKMRLKAGLILMVLCAAPASLSAALAQSGEDLFKDCATCHSLEADANGVGPSLHGLLGRKIASVEGFRYSNIFKAQKWVWTDEVLDRFLADPQAMLRGNKMPFSGMSDPAQRKALIEWLKEATK